MKERLLILLFLLFGFFIPLFLSKIFLIMENYHWYIYFKIKKWEKSSCQLETHSKERSHSTIYYTKLYVGNAEPLTLMGRRNAGVVTVKIWEIRREKLENHNSSVNCQNLK